MSKYYNCELVNHDTVDKCGSSSQVNHKFDANIELRQHNIAPTSYITCFGTGVVSDDGTQLYSIDQNDVNLIHCVEMNPNGILK